MEQNNTPKQEDGVKVCPGDCLQCSAQQRNYCAGQMSRNALEVAETTAESVNRLLEAVQELSEKFGQMQGSEPASPVKRGRKAATTEPQ